MTLPRLRKQWFQIPSWQGKMHTVSCIILSFILQAFFAYAKDTANVKEGVCMNSHNALRALHQNTGPLQWSDELQEGAQKWADHLIATDTFAYDYSFSGGENLFLRRRKDQSGCPASCAAAYLRWYYQINNYDYKYPNKTQDAGHFTQLVWKGSTHLGVGVAFKRIGDTAITIIVARYRPAGNIPYQFESNVLPTTGAPVPTLKELDPSAAQCENLNLGQAVCSDNNPTCGIYVKYPGACLYIADRCPKSCGKCSP